MSAPPATPDPALSETRLLVEEAARGDRSAVEALLERYLPELRAFVRLRAGAVVRARETHSDIVQSACREVLERADGFRYASEAGFKRWLYTTALRKILNKRDYHCAERRDVGREEAPPSGPSAAAEAQLLQGFRRFASPSQVAVAREELERIERSFAELPDEYREVILLARVVGLSRAEIGVEMGRGESAVRALLHRALARLAQTLTGASGDA